MKIILILVLVFFLTSCGHIMVYDGDPEKEGAEPIWVVINAPDELTVERTTEERGTEKLVIKKKSGDWNPLTFIGKVFTNIVALVFGRAGDVQVPIGN